MLDKVKLALRISHNLLDSDINDTIDTARAEMVRAGVDSDLAESTTNKLIIQAIKTYCLYVYASDTKMADGYKVSWEYQLDNIRKATILLNAPVEED